MPTPNDKKRAAAPNDKQLEEIKRLLMVLLLKLGSTSDEIAVALNVDSSRVRQMMPTSKIEKLVNNGGKNETKRK